MLRDIRAWDFFAKLTHLYLTVDNRYLLLTGKTSANSRGWTWYGELSSPFFNHTAHTTLSVWHWRSNQITQLYSWQTLSIDGSQIARTTIRGAGNVWTQSVLFYEGVRHSESQIVFWVNLANLNATFALDEIRFSGDFLLK